MLLGGGNHQGTRVDLGLELPGQSRMAGNGQRDSCLSGPLYVQRLRKLRTTSTLDMSLTHKMSLTQILKR